MSRSHTQVPQPKGEFKPETVWKVSQAVRECLRGKTNNVGDVTLRAGQTTTTLNDPLIGPESFIDFMPTTENAATAKAGLYVSSRTAGSATITHASSANTDQNFTYCIIG